MRTGPWLDHLPPWMAWGAIASTGAYSPEELGAMAVPLLAGAFVEARRGSLHRYRRVLELIALAVFLSQVLARTGVLTTVVFTLFTLCGVRLCLPREPPQQRQLLLMGFLLFLTTALATSELDFLVWSTLWVAGTCACLLQLNWRKSAQLPQGHAQHPAPFRRIPVWTAAVLVMAAGFFMVLPRLRLGVRGLPLGIQSPGGLHAGLSDAVDLSLRGPIQGSREVVMRILPLVGRPGIPGAFALLRGLVLEDLDGQRWALSRSTPQRADTTWSGSPPVQPFTATCYLSPDPMAILPTPYGRVELEPTDGERLHAGEGASIRWTFPVRRILPLVVGVRTMECEPEAPPRGARLDLLTRPGAGTSCALRFAQRVAPGRLPPRELASRLAQALQRFHYSLDNPSGGAANPLEDFLERSRTGHCEFFASALAIMLRQRGVPARVVNGYRLGPWIQEGGYYLVTQNEAHSWVEYYDPLARGWRTEDPTPAAPASAFTSGSFMAAFVRLADTVRFAWDRHVVRFSDEDQLAGLDWASAKMSAWTSGWNGPAFRAALTILGGLGLLAGLARAVRRPLLAPAGAPGRIPELRPLLRAAARTAPPLPGETVRTWLARLGGLRSDRAPQLEALAREADAVAYGGKGAAALARMAREEARAFRSGPA